MSASGITIMWFLAPPKHCTRLPCAAAGRIDVLRDVGRADEADRLDAVVGQQRVDRFLVAVDDVEDAFRQAGLEEQFGDPHRHRRIALRRLEDEGVAAGDRRRAFPQRDHGREVERRDAGDDAERLAHRIKIDAGAGALGVFALQQMRDAAGEFDHFEAALDVAFGVGNGLAVFGRQQLGEAVIFLLATSSRNLNITRARRCGLVAAQAGWAASALAMACSTSACWPARPWPAPRRYWGRRRRPARPEVPLTVLPPMKWPISRMGRLLRF